MTSADQRLFERAVASMQTGALDEAERGFVEFLRRNPKHFGALNLVGNLLTQRRQYSDAETYLRLALDVSMSEVTLYNYATVLKALKRPAEAFDRFTQALEINPKVPETWNNRGAVLNDLKRYAEAIGDFERAVALNPQYADAYYNMGRSFFELKQLDQALAVYDRALRLKPNFVEALSNRANTLRELKRTQEALAGYEQALAINPSDVATLDGLAAVLLKQGKVSEAIECLTRALVIRPSSPTIHTNLIFALNFSPSATAAEHQAERARRSHQHTQGLTRFQHRPSKDADPPRRLRVGYVSSNFRGQAATYAFGGVLLCHDPERFEVVCYSDTLQEDSVTDSLRLRANTWHRTASLSDDELAELIRRDNIDILVDLVGHMGGHRLLAFARKPAPIQVTAWGEPTGTGVEAIDYLLADPVLVPVDERALLSERVVELPNFLGYWMPDAVPEPGPLPAQTNGYVTFGSFNRVEKIMDPVLRAWAGILRAIPNARLVLKDGGFADSSQRAQIEGRLAGEGIAAERVALLGQTDRAGHFVAYQGIDIALDPFPHGGGMTTLDSLWMGVPVVAWSGRTISSRLAAASLTTMGLSDFIARDLDGYIALAVAKASDFGALERLRLSLRERVLESTIGDPTRYARAVESAYTTMWEIRQRGEAPRSFSV